MEEQKKKKLMTRVNMNDVEELSKKLKIEMQLQKLSLQEIES